MNDASNGPKPGGNARTPPAARKNLWPWFGTGFIIVFIGMSLSVTMYSMLPSGKAVVACPLWQYYIIETRRELSSSGRFGPASGSFTAAIATAFEHVLCSSIGGAAMSAIGWAVRRIKARRRNTA